MPKNTPLNKETWASRLRRRMNTMGEHRALYADILAELGRLPYEVPVEYLDVKGPHPWGCSATLLVRADWRGRVPSFMDALRPRGLKYVTFRKGGGAIWPADREVDSRVGASVGIPLIPVTYELTRNYRQKPRHTAHWITKLGQERVAVACDIAEDRADFKLDHLDDVGHNQVLWRWVANAYVPKGRTRGYSGQWSPVKENGASLTVYWAWEDVNVAGGMAALRLALLKVLEAEEVSTSGPTEQQ